MDSDIQLISDGDGLAVIGDATDVERFLASEGLLSRDLGLHRLTPAVGAGAVVAQAGAEIAANSGRWVKLTRESAQSVQKYGLRKSHTTGLSTGVVKGHKGQIKGFVEFVKRPGSLLTNPAILTGAAGIMAQVAMQQAMDDITDYLAAIDEKLDDVLRAQKDAALARMIGVGLVIEETVTIRETRGRVDEVMWSKVQSAPATIGESQAYALRQLSRLLEVLSVTRRSRRKST
jgi:site-specific recombinase XerC